MLWRCCQSLKLECVFTTSSSKDGWSLPTALAPGNKWLEVLCLLCCSVKKMSFQKLYKDSENNGNTGSRSKHCLIPEAKYTLDFSVMWNIIFLFALNYSKIVFVPLSPGIWYQMSYIFQKVKMARSHLLLVFTFLLKDL